MSSPTSNNSCESITLFAISPEYLSSAQSENRKLCGICLKDFRAGDQAARNGCCQALACLTCLSRSANMRMEEGRGGGLPAWAKCQLCGQQFDREPLNSRVPVVTGAEEEATVQGSELPVDGEQIDVSIPLTEPTTSSNDDVAVEEGEEEGTETVEFDDGWIRVIRTADGNWMYSVGDHDTFIDRDFTLVEGATLDLAGVMAWGRMMTRHLPQERRQTREEALQGLDHYTFYEWVSSDSEDED